MLVVCLALSLMLVDRCTSSALKHIGSSPIWIWLAVNEIPSRTIVAGGALLLAAILGATLWEIRDARISKDRAS